MSRKFSLLLLLFTALFCSLSAQVISYEKMASFSKEDLKERWKKGAMPRVLVPIRYGVDIYEVLYYARYADGEKVKASGVMFVPVDAKKPLPRLVYNHGTIVNPKRNGFDYNGESTIALIFATDGYAVLSPDYVGLGKGERNHLYIHAETEAEAGIGFLRASEELEEKLGLEYGEMLFSTGYSQGGHATLAFHKRVQEEYADQWTVTASSPMSGPYDVAGVQAEVMWEEYTQPHYLPYLLMGYNEAYEIWPEEEFFDIFAEPYNRQIPGLFDRKHSVGAINDALPEIPKNMMKPEFVDKYKNEPDYFFRELLLENSVHDWKPEAPVQLCFCKGDEEVKYENALVAREHMKARGAKHVYLKHVGKKYTHRACADYSVLYTKFFLDSFRKGSKKGRKGPLFKRLLVTLGKWTR